MLRQWCVSWVGVGVMLTFLDAAHMVDATAMMGVLGWGGGDGNVSWRCTWDNVKKQVVFWNHDDTFSHATWAKSSFRYSGMLIFCPYNVHFLHGREKLGNLVVRTWSQIYVIYCVCIYINVYIYICTLYGLRYIHQHKYQHVFCCISISGVLLGGISERTRNRLRLGCTLLF